MDDLPSWDDCVRAIDGGHATPLHVFIHDNEPADVGLEGAHTATEFRQQLAAALAHAATRASTAAYYLQVRGYAGNSLLWWRRGSQGYTADIRQAEVFTHAAAFAQASMRPHQDFPWRKDYVDAHLQHHVNSECVSRTDEGAV